jgi:hypothetical protein
MGKMDIRRRGSGGRKALLRMCKGVCNRPSSSHAERDKGGFLSALFLSPGERGYKGVLLHPSSSPLMREDKGEFSPPFFLSSEGILVNKGNIFWCEIHQR